jgi:hypothetical protein
MLSRFDFLTFRGYFERQVNTPPDSRRKIKDGLGKFLRIEGKLEGDYSAHHLL